MSKFKGRQPAGPSGDGESQVVSRGMLNELWILLDFTICCEEIAGVLTRILLSMMQQEHVEWDPLNTWKLNNFNIIDKRIISFYYNN